MGICISHPRSLPFRGKRRRWRRRRGEAGLPAARKGKPNQAGLPRDFSCWSLFIWAHGWTAVYTAKWNGSHCRWSAMVSSFLFHCGRSNAKNKLERPKPHKIVLSILLPSDTCRSTIPLRNEPAKSAITFLSRTKRYTNSKIAAITKGRYSRWCAAPHIIPNSLICQTTQMMLINFQAITVQKVPTQTA